MSDHIIYGTQYMKDAAFPFWILRTFHGEQTSPQPHGHDFVELVFVVRGEAHHLFENHRYPIRSGDTFVINPGEKHTYEVAAGKQIEIINCLFRPSLIKDSWLKELGVSSSMDYFYVHPFLDRKERFHHQLNLREKEASRVLSLLETMHEELRERSSGFYTLIRLQLVELFILLSRYYQQQVSSEGSEVTNEQRMIQRVCGYIERHYNEKITRTSLAELSHLSTRQLNRVFKKETDMTIVEMIQNVRMNRAKALLRETDEKIITIAGAVGYDDPAFFSKLFVRHEGCSPGDYRKKPLDAAPAKNPSRMSPSQMHSEQDAPPSPPAETRWDSDRDAVEKFC